MLNAYFIQRKLRTKHTIVAAYTPPPDLMPYELGYLYDNTFADNELFAALVSMAQRDIIDVNLADPANFTITACVLTSDQRVGLNEAEQAIYTSLIEAYGTKADWRTLSGESSQIGGMQSDFEDAVLQGLQRKGYLHVGSVWQTLQERSLYIKIVSFLLTALLIFLPLYLIHVATQATQLSGGYASLDQGINNMFIGLIAVLAWPVMYFYCQLIAYIYFRSSGLPLGSTPQLRALWPQVVGHRLFVKTVDWPRMQSHVDFADELLPYCIAYGLYKAPTNALAKS